MRALNGSELSELSNPLFWAGLGGSFSHFLLVLTLLGGPNHPSQPPEDPLPEVHICQPGPVHGPAVQHRRVACTRGGWVGYTYKGGLEGYRAGWEAYPGWYISLSWEARRLLSTVIPPSSGRLGGSFYRYSLSSGRLGGPLSCPTVKRVVWERLLLAQQ